MYLLPAHSLWLAGGTTPPAKATSTSLYQYQQGTSERSTLHSGDAQHFWGPDQNPPRPQTFRSVPLSLQLPAFMTNLLLNYFQEPFGDELSNAYRVIPMYWDPLVFKMCTRKARYVLKSSLLFWNDWNNIGVGEISLILLKNTEFD